jgi:predicted ABC-class ATPase
LNDPFPFNCQGSVVLCKTVGCSETIFPVINMVSKLGTIYVNIVGGMDEYVDPANNIIELDDYFTS